MVGSVGSGLLLGASGAGGSTLWNPVLEGAALPGDFEAFDPATLTLVSNKVSAWANKGAGGGALTQASDGNRPNFSATGLNGKPAVVSQGNFPSLSMTPGAGWPGLPDPITIVLLSTVAATSANFGNAVAFSGSANNAGSMRAITNVFDNSVPKVFLNANGSGYTSGVSWDVPVIVVAEFKAGTQTQYFNGELNGRASSMGFSTLVAPLGLSLFGGFVTGAISAVYFYNGSMPTAVRQRFEGYLAPMAGITLPTGHPWRGVAPTI